MSSKKSTQQKSSNDKSTTWTAHAWEDYLHWHASDPKTAESINRLVKGVLRDPFKGIGKPEPLKGDLAGFWSRRINMVDRFVYQFEDGQLTITQCRYHY